MPCRKFNLGKKSAGSLFSLDKIFKLNMAIQKMLMLQKFQIIKKEKREPALFFPIILKTAKTEPVLNCPKLSRKWVEN